MPFTGQLDGDHIQPGNEDSRNPGLVLPELVMPGTAVQLEGLRGNVGGIPELTGPVCREPGLGLEVGEESGEL